MSSAPFSPYKLRLILPDEAATLACAAACAPVLEGGLCVYLLGGLGAGKTTWVRGLLRALGHTGTVKSPTYTLLESYALAAPQGGGLRWIHHCDLYRFASPAEWLEAGFDALLDADAVLLTEWPERASDVLPAPDWTFLFEEAVSGRILHGDAASPRGVAALQRAQAGFVAAGLVQMPG